MFQKPFLILLSDCSRDIVISDCDCDIVSDCARFFDDDDKRVYKSNKPVVSILISADSSSTPLRAFVLRSKLALRNNNYIPIAIAKIKDWERSLHTTFSRVI